MVRSTVRDRKDALRVLGVLKVATATQIMRLVRPHLSDNKTMRNALLDLVDMGEVVSEGNTAGPEGRFGAPDRTGEPSQKLWSLTPSGLDAAGLLLGRGPEEMGGRARGVSRGGAPHAMAVNATITAFTAGGVGDITSWRTEVPHALSECLRSLVVGWLRLDDGRCGVWRVGSAVLPGVWGSVAADFVGGNGVLFG